jgi:hypothetical protein
MNKLVGHDVPNWYINALMLLGKRNIQGLPLLFSVPQKSGQNQNRRQNASDRVPWVKRMSL